jgi:hypothetical protein
MAVTALGVLEASRGAANPSTPSHQPAATPSASDRYEDGIPRTFDGQAVLRWTDALAMRRTATDGTPFLTGVWLDIPTGVFSCPADHGPDPSAPDSWISTGGCQFNYVSSDAGAAATTQNGVTTFRFYSGTLATGPAIMRVHLHDSRAGQCGAQANVCDAMLVVDDILWTGDAQTAPHPLTVDKVMVAAQSVAPASDLHMTTATSYFGCGANARDGLMLCPPLVTGEPYSSPIAGAVVLPSSSALAQALPVTPGLDGALTSSAMARSQSGSSGSWDYRWLVVDNAALLVRTTPGVPSQADIDFLRRLQAALVAVEDGRSGAKGA